ncbi:hypothetical protein ABZ920_21785 [Streptomyces sp. NPDC046831]|uniref:hypothetical protein n=1 Tax=Streptomyces sp. NPDC046831 TaxID=3154805 RepID=UPI0033E8475D
MAEQKSSGLAAPLHSAASVLRKVPGAGTVGRAAQGTLDKVGAMSPRGRRLAVYTGAGVLGVTGVVEWPVAVTGAAVAWLTRPRPEHTGNGGQRVPAQDTTEARRIPVEDAGTASRDAGPDLTGAPAQDATGAPAQDTTGASRDVGTATAAEHAAAEPAGTHPAERTEPGRTQEAKETGTAQAHETSAEGKGRPPTSRASTGPLGPTARPGRTTL